MITEPEGLPTPRTEGIMKCIRDAAKNNVSYEYRAALWEAAKIGIEDLERELAAANARVRNEQAIALRTEHAHQAALRQMGEIQAELSAAQARIAELTKGEAVAWMREDGGSPPLVLAQVKSHWVKEAFAEYDVPLFRAPPAPSWIPVGEEMVNRFLAWRLPADFAPDCGISFDGRKDDEWNKNKTWPTGTNLFTAVQAKAMLEHVFAAPLPTPLQEEK